MGSLLCKQAPGQDRKKAVCMLEGTRIASQGIGIPKAVFPVAQTSPACSTPCHTVGTHGYCAHPPSPPQALSGDRKSGMLAYSRKQSLRAHRLSGSLTFWPQRE